MDDVTSTMDKTHFALAGSQAASSGRLSFSSGYFDALGWPIAAKIAWNFVITAAVGLHVLANWLLRCLRLPGGSRLSVATTDWLGWWECILISVLAWLPELVTGGNGLGWLAGHTAIALVAAVFATPLVERVLKLYAANLALDGRRVFSFARPFGEIYVRTALLMTAAAVPFLLPLAFLPFLRWLPASMPGQDVSFTFEGSLWSAAARLASGSFLLAAPPILLEDYLRGQGIEDWIYAEGLPLLLLLTLVPVVLRWWLSWVAANIVMRRTATS